MFRSLIDTFKRLRRQPGLVIVCTLTLAVGLGACTTVFSLFNAVLLRELPYGNAESLVYVWAPHRLLPGLPLNALGPAQADYFDLERDARSFSSMAFYNPSAFNLSAGSTTERLSGARVSASFFSTLEAVPARGRVLVKGDDEAGRDGVAVISHRLWQSALSADTNVLERSLVLNRRSFRIVGVMPPAFRYPRSEDLLPGEIETDSTDVWVPLVLTAEERASRDFSDNMTIARLAPGVSLGVAQAELIRVGANLDAARPAETQGSSLVVQGLVSTSIGTARRLLWVLLGAVCLVLLVACSNAAHLMSTRTLGRAREMGIRAALGASRRHLFGQMMSESLILAFAGGTLGVLMAMGVVRLLTTVNPGNIPRLEDATVDQRVMLFGFALTVLAGVLAGLIPARWASRMDAKGLLATNPSMLMSKSVARARPVLIVAQVALTIVLVTGAGLLLRSFVTIHRVDTGFEASAFNARLWLDDRYQTERDQRRFFSQLLDVIRARQGIEVAGLVDALPLSHSERMGRFEVQGFANQREQLIHTRAASPGYFEAIGTPLLEGRPFAMTDDDRRPRVLIVNQAFARQYFGGRSPVGGRVRFLGDEVSPWYSVIGVVRNVRHSNVEDAPAPQIYECLWQSASDQPYLVVRSNLPSDAVASIVRETAHAIDPAVAIGRLGTMKNLVGEATARRRFETSVLTAFGGVAVLLSAIGLFGLVSYTGRQRRKEIGIRLALGASRFNVVWLLARQGLGLAIAGAAIGVVAAAFLTRLLQSMLYGISATDPVSFALAAGTLAMTAAVASYIPSRRATTMDVVDVLRQD